MIVEAAASLEGELEDEFDVEQSDEQQLEVRGVESGVNSATAFVQFQDKCRSGFCATCCACFDEETPVRASHATDNICRTTSDSSVAGSLFVAAALLLVGCVDDDR